MREVLCLEDGQGVFADSTGVHGVEPADRRMKMAEYVREPARFDRILREKGVVVVMGKDHAREPEYVVNTVRAIYEA